MSEAKSQTIRYASLIVLVVQSCALVLLLRWSRTRQVDMYIVSSVVCTVELIKLVMSLAIECFRLKSISKMADSVVNNVVLNPKETLLMLVPAALYAAQNNMVFVAISNLDTMTFQVTYQLKILTTALFSVFLLKKSLTVTQWMSLVILVAGVALVQMDSSGSSRTSENAVEQNRMLGFFMICLCSLSSGFSGVYFEKIVKSRTGKFTKQPLSIWIRNFQLGIFGLAFSIMALFVQDWEQVATRGFFHGYDSVTMLIMAFQAFGGLLVGIVISYADNLLKGFATSLSIVLSSWLSYLFFDVVPSVELLIGCALVILATYLYSLPVSEPVYRKVEDEPTSSQ